MVICYHGYSQNLVPNPGFETITWCNLNGSGIQNNESPPWNSPNGSSPDLYNSCSSMPTWSVPGNQFGYQPARSGNGYAGATMYTDVDYREYCQVKLLSPLVANQRYCVSFYVSLSGPWYVGCNNIGMYISSTNFSGTSITPLHLVPQVVEKSVIMDTLNWTLIKGSYLATGGEQYIVIGNFAPFSSIDTLRFPSTIIPGAYYYIDDADIHLASLTECPLAPPTPAVDNFRIMVSTTDHQIRISGQNGSAYINIYNAMGQLLYKTSFSQALTINTGFLPKGIYFLYFNDKKKKITKKFLVI